MAKNRKSRPEARKEPAPAPKVISAAPSVDELVGLAIRIDATNDSPAAAKASKGLQKLAETSYKR